MFDELGLESWLIKAICCKKGNCPIFEISWMESKKVSTWVGGQFSVPIFKTPFKNLVLN